MASFSAVSEQMKKYYNENKLLQRDLDQLISVKNSIGNVIANDLYPGSKPKLVAYGSAVSGFGTKDSDVDCCLWFSGDVAQNTSSRDQRRGHEILTKIYHHLDGMKTSSPVMEDIIPSVEGDPVAVMKCKSKRNGKSVDINVDMTPGVVCAFLMRKYREYHEDVAALGVIVKQWRTNRRLKLSSTACVLMAINYMQVKEYLPVIAPMGYQWESFPLSCRHLDIQQLEQMMISGVFGGQDDIFPSSNARQQMPSLNVLVKGFFEYYAEFPFEKKKIRVSVGTADDRATSSSEPIFIEDPIDKDNVANRLGGGHFTNFQNHLRHARRVLRQPGGNWEAIVGTRNVSSQMEDYYDDNKLKQQDLKQLLSVKISIGNVIASDMYQGAKLVAYGSAMSGFGTKDSDVDCCLWFSGEPALHWNERDKKRGLQMLKGICQHLNGMGQSGPVKNGLSLRVKEDPPVMMCKSTRNAKSVDVQVDMTPAIVSTFLQWKYKECDVKVAQLGVIVKLWRTKQDIWLSSSACVLMAIHYMQAKTYLPVIRPKGQYTWESFPESCVRVDVQQLERMMINGSLYGSQDIFEYSHHASYTVPPLDQLVKGFFQYYADFAFEATKIRVSTGTAEYRGRTTAEPIFVEDPIYRSNLAASTNVASFQKLREQLRCARDILQRPGDWQAIMNKDVYGAGHRGHDDGRKIQVFVRLVNGNPITVDIRQEDLVQTLKKEIQKETGIAPGQQTLTYGGSTLENGRTLASYGIGNEATIHMVGRLRGGH